MQILILHAGSGRTRSWTVGRLRLAAASVALVLLLGLLGAVLYHHVLLRAVHGDWPVLGPVARLLVQDAAGGSDRYLRENLDAMARRAGELQANLVRLEALGERVSGLAGVQVPPATVQEGGPGKRAAPPGAASPPAAGSAPAARPGAGGPYLPAPLSAAPRTPQELDRLLEQLDEQAARQADVFTLIESKLFEKRLAELMVPSSLPVQGPIGSGFGFRSDPFTGRQALHTGLDFPADVGTPIVAAAGGVVIHAGLHPQYGQMVEVDHGNGLVTRYAHASRLRVKAGDLVRRGQLIAEVGSTGRSTGPHLHFEVLVQGVQQDPGRFLERALARR
ncbi:MAG: M23 family metallopeptidase [Aquabacterium sp.]|nr:M23 family metallopeptidase [Aquabacterium sp.]